MIGKKKVAPKVELKPLSFLLRYEVFGPNSTYLVIVNASLSEKRLKKLLCVLRKFRKVIWYTISDIKGIDPIDPYGTKLHELAHQNGFASFISKKKVRATQYLDYFDFASLGLTGDLDFMFWNVGWKYFIALIDDTYELLAIEFPIHYILKF